MENYSKFVEKEVYENQIEYDKRMLSTEKGYIKYLKQGKSPQEFADLMRRIWRRYRPRIHGKSLTRTT